MGQDLTELRTPVRLRHRGIHELVVGLLPEPGNLDRRRGQVLALHGKELLAQLEQMLPKLSPAARREAELTDLPKITDHLQTFRYRRAHWKGRLERLNDHTSRR